MKKILIIAGGTGGHIFPGIAVADALTAKGCDVAWLGSKIGLEKTLVPKRYPMHVVSVFQLRGKGLLAKLGLPFQLTRSVCQALRLLRRLKPDVVVAFGGFVAGPGAIAAKLLKIPLIIHEQNARAGLTNRYLAKISKMTLQAFPQAFSSTVVATTVGNPVRDTLLKIPEPSIRLADHQGALRILVLGGSLGARALNDAVIDWWQRYHSDAVCLRHQTGKMHIDTVRKQYAQHDLSADALPFIDDMEAALRWADLVICRAGAITVAELSDVGIAAIYIPMPHAMDNHQYYNAKYLSDKDAALLIEQKNITADSLNMLIAPFITDRQRVIAMSEKARASAMRDATATIATIVIKAERANLPQINNAL
ncbi:MAG: undecaprenyldiphospho-muramoylpentapeptide beta-N-acetylglucosaminyltransferase [Coxiella sp. (in: Bacteria)]|nr:MAG: undecaprenyldiphospho-muramoylpentapeptide beta-N-acetylglucosaminyltransferase [Coxiella sp. (in: g-proteobacteria)]